MFLYGVSELRDILSLNCVRFVYEANLGVILGLFVSVILYAVHISGPLFANSFVFVFYGEIDEIFIGSLSKIIIYVEERVYM